VPSFTVFVYLAVIKGSGSVDYHFMRAQGVFPANLYKYGTSLLPVQQVKLYESLGPIEQGTQFSGIRDSEVRI